MTYIAQFSLIFDLLCRANEGKVTTTAYANDCGLFSLAPPSSFQWKETAVPRESSRISAQQGKHDQLKTVNKDPQHLTNA